MHVTVDHAPSGYGGSNPSLRNDKNRVPTWHSVLALWRDSKAGASPPTGGRVRRGREHLVF